MFEFVWPIVFVLVLLLPLVRLLVRPQEHEQVALEVPNVEHFRFDGATDDARLRTKQLAKLVLLGFAWIALVAALARPQWTGEPVPLPTSGRDIMLAVDISGSMNMSDMMINLNVVSRLEALKHVVQAFIEQRSGDRIGLIMFGTRAYVYVPLTFDIATVRQLLLEAPGGIAGSQTAIGDTIGLAVKRLIERPAEHRVLVLMTDGSHNEGMLSPEEASRLAVDSGVRVHTVGIGSDGFNTPGGMLTSLRARSNPMDEATLQMISDTTGGKYFRAKDTDALEQIYEEISKLEPVTQDPETLRPVKALFHWPLSIALAAFLFLWWIRE